MQGAGRVNPLHSTGLLLYIAQKMKKSFMENFIFCAVIPTDNMRKLEVLTHVFLGV